MIASLMMYARPELALAHKRYWELIRRNLTAVGINSPMELSQGAEEFSVWKHPELVLSQTCGMPYRLWLHNKVALVGTPDFGISDCPAGYYRSALVVRSDDPRNTIDAFRNGVFAYNQTFSQSGYAAAFSHLRPRGFWFENRLHTQQHILSALAVAERRADIASIDAVSLRLMQKHEGFTDALRVLEWTKPTPGLPLITANGQNAELIFDAVEKAIGQLSVYDKADLGLMGIVKIPTDKYLEVANPPQNG